MTQNNLKRSLSRRSDSTLSTSGPTNTSPSHPGTTFAFHRGRRFIYRYPTPPSSYEIRGSALRSDLHFIICISSFGSIFRIEIDRTPRYLKLLLKVILLPCILSFGAMNDLRFVINIDSVFSAANFRPCSFNHLSQRLRLSLVIISRACGKVWEITSATSSAYPIICAPFGSSRFRSPSYIIFHKSGPKTDPCGTPALFSQFSIPYHKRYVGVVTGSYSSRMTSKCYVYDTASSTPTKGWSKAVIIHNKTQRRNHLTNMILKTASWVTPSVCIRAFIISHSSVDSSMSLISTLTVLVAVRICTPSPKVLQRASFNFSACPSPFLSLISNSPYNSTVISMPATKDLALFLSPSPLNFLFKKEHVDKGRVSVFELK
ncbi:hypothetical protein FF38_04596 [Lucilia cuprina]|uniref:Uncharacterized protein n=1 Tax=Lucilia cuprina TaxID=7375 RepID=A0A0L0BYJ5_LUCCU|nr:hypothetical protein FF38_04596 [Lucilia cuprina]